LALRFDDIPAPESFVLVEDSAAREMPCRDAVDGRAAERPHVTPIEFVRGCYPFGPKQPSYAQRNDEHGVSTAREPAQHRQIQVVIVIVADEHDINAREIVPAHPRASPAPRADPRKRTRTLRPNWIGQNVRGASLQQNR
jgi:hypothetical protein